MLAAALRRFVMLFALSSGLTVIASLLLGLAFGASAARSLSLGFYVVGAFLLIAGFFMGNRGPVRLKGEPGAEGVWGFGSGRRVRWATKDEREEAINLSAVFVVLGLALILVGVAADSRYTLF
jgi:uncharacterized membrane protein